MYLSEYYEKLPDSISPKTIFVEQVAQRCGVKTDSVRNWIKGRSLPAKPHHYQVLQEITQIPSAELFPIRQGSSLIPGDQNK